ncbi:hypothetical protein NQ317_014273 [Molorchus minor]|uniref:Uncharacterized protein n=1 Tax=Molorchus minor TaxID=1323400 RepID=A0ABQ9JMF1_9CUCU|nr:hypothetical protein NQ317_014273 [Molorchus minor]
MTHYLEPLDLISHNNFSNFPPLSHDYVICLMLSTSVQYRGMQLGSGKLQHTSVISVNHADADQPPSLYLAPMASQNYLFGSLRDGDKDADWQKVAIFVNKTHVVWIYFVVLIL